ncbi:MAG: hypothetical protein U1E47_03180 [Rivihabitans pingtungensis]
MLDESGMCMGALASMANDSLGSTVATTSLMVLPESPTKAWRRSRFKVISLSLTSTVKRLLP